MHRTCLAENVEGLSNNFDGRRTRLCSLPSPKPGSGHQLDGELDDAEIQLDIPSISFAGNHSALRRDFAYPSAPSAVHLGQSARSSYHPRSQSTRPPTLLPATAVSLGSFRFAVI